MTEMAPVGVPIAPTSFPKKYDGWRPCGDYRALKAKNIPGQYTFRHIADFAQKIASRKASPQ